jgi:hypothetical protein
MPAPDLTIAIIHHRLRGYPQECIESLAPLPAGTELLLIQTGPGADAESRFVPQASACGCMSGLNGRGVNPAPQQSFGNRTCFEYPHPTDSAGAARPPLASAPVQARVIPVGPDASRAAAKNLAVAEARGEHLLLATSDTVSSLGTVEQLRRFLGESGGPAVASAQLLQENGMPRRTGFALPSIAHELNFVIWLRRQRRFPLRSRKPPVAGPARKAEALHAAFLMARRETFRSIGEFAEGYRFAFEDLEWSWRARRKGIALYVCPAAPAYKLAPQLKGDLSPEMCLALEASKLRCLRATRGSAYAQAFRATRASKSLAVWLAAAGLNRLLCGASELLENQSAVHRALWKMRADVTSGAELPPDIESCVRWETFV